MNAIDDIRIRADVAEVSDAEAAAVIEWCREWAKECDWADIGETNELDGWPIPALLRSCDRHLDGGIAFVLADVRASR